MTLFVFAHGLGGFDEIPLPGYPIRYFRDLAPELARAGLRALFTTVSNFQDVEGRARDLARQLDGVAAERIVRHYEPAVVVLTGIAGGVKDVGIGDVVVGT